MVKYGMLSDQVKEAVTALAPALRERGVTGLFLFGSVATGEAGDGSDVDLFLDYDPMSRFSLFDQMKVEEMLATRLGRKVDLMTRGGLHPLIKDKIVSSAIRML